MVGVQRDGRGPIFENTLSEAYRAYAPEGIEQITWRGESFAERIGAPSIVAPQCTTNNDALVAKFC